MIANPLIMSDELYNALIEYRKTCMILGEENPKEIDGLIQVRQGILSMPNIPEEYKIVLANVEARLNELKQNEQTLTDLCTPYYEKVVELANKELAGKLIYNSHYGRKVIFAERASVNSDWIRVTGKVFDLDELKLEYNGENRTYGIFQLTADDIKRAPWSTEIDQQYFNKMITEKFDYVRLLVNKECCNLANKK